MRDRGNFIVLQGEDCFLPHEESANLRLAALAPEMAQLLVDMAEAVREYTTAWRDPRVQEILARFDALGKDTA